MIVPDNMVEAVEKIASSLAICAPTLAQHAALACSPTTRSRPSRTAAEPSSSAATTCCPNSSVRGLRVPVGRTAPSISTPTSATWHGQHRSQRLLLEAGVGRAGPDFGPAHGDHTMRFSYATGPDRPEAAVDRMGKLLGH